MATLAKRDEIIFIIISRVAPELLMMDFQVCHRAAELAAPTIAPQHSCARFFVVAIFQPERLLPPEELTH
jgi:hypothetical protein